MDTEDITEFFVTNNNNEEKDLFSIFNKTQT